MDSLVDVKGKVLTAIERGNDSSAKICRVMGIASPYVWENHVISRRIDTALQQLRRAGVLKYDRIGGWRKAEVNMSKGLAQYDIRRESGR